MGNIAKTVSSETAGASASSEYKPSGLEGRYLELVPIREPFLKRARAAALLTIPSLIPPQGHSSTTNLYVPWQSIGSRGVNNLAAKLLMALLPTDPFFRHKIPSAVLMKIAEEKNADTLKSDLEEALSKYEKEIMDEIESGSTRVSSFESFLHLIVGGNACPYLPPEGGMKVYHLDSYVVVRDPMGNLLELITEESISPIMLPDEIKVPVHDRCKDSEKTIKLHTVVRRDTKRKFLTYQEVKGIEIPGSRGSYPVDACPYIPLRLVKIDGEDYGRGWVEGLQGDLKSVEGLSQSIVEGSAAAAKMLMLVNPNGVTKLKTVAEAPNGAIRTGNAADVTVVQSQKSIDLRIAKETRTEIKGDLESAFLMASSIQRNAERVTAEEIRLLASELESTLGGVYSLLAQEFQLPLVARITAQMVKQKKLTPLPKGVKPIIVTGLEALSRGADLERLDRFMDGVEKMGPQVVEKYVNYTDYFTRRATALSLDKKGLIKGADQIAEETAQAQKQAAMSTLAGPGIKAVTDIATKGINPNGTAPQVQPTVAA